MARIKVENWISQKGLLQIKEWASQGLTDKEIAESIKVSTPTLWKWRKKYPEIDVAIEEGREPVIIDVENCFIASCKDRYVEEVKTIKSPDGDITTITTNKFIPAKTGAMIFFLKNRYPEKWREPVENANYKKIQLENEKLLKDISLKDLQIETLKQNLANAESQLEKVDLILESLSNNAIIENAE